MSRTQNSLINLIVALIGQGLGLIISFIARIFFVKILGTEYLGINGLFTNILTMLSLVELGIGPAIVFSLYKPLSENDIKKVKSLMHLYKEAYTIIGIIILILGLILTPFLSLFIKNMPDVPNIHFIFLLFVINSSLSYFFSYKRNLIIADQQRYIATAYRYIFFIALNFLQIIFLLITRNYVTFLVLQIISTLLENIAISKTADKRYPFLKDRQAEKLDTETVQEIKKNTGAMVLHKIGGIVVKSTDNILISAKVGITWVGLYSNYQLILNALDLIIGQFFSAITASVGNLGATGNKKKALAVFQNIQFINFWIYSFSAICFYYIANPFINWWIGEEFVMNDNVILVLTINFYIQGMRKSVLTFRDALGLYWKDRYKPIFEVIINIVVSIMLAPRLGISGIFIGTIVSTLTTCFWIEPYVLYKYGFESTIRPYFLRYVKNILLTLMAWYLTGIFNNFLPENTNFMLIFKLLICLVIPNIMFLIVFYRTTEFEYFVSIINNNIVKKITKRH
ncbi:oligosaccharide flippase family protein [uncultured Trichococcus sp.]|uniref:lipopolysaccharide biosynthesis protein n=1 Tax=uncultured Trichococcus sp. TaxID=189665 RepID=UPI0029C9532A|nr:oligosaccharide flippase family protein [uncultured Trichococcus sp.]